ncbi:hypothetical protein [Marinobacter sp. NFXS9]|uniref:hypothetical protein n=1 Tax=Marinobacter sp. NFXS9 TaxID=2818433 RepID=UPI0032DEF2BC
MKWKKLGKIFDPIEHPLPNDCVEYAQSPQALIFDEFVRIYFASRPPRNEAGQYLSHIAYADYTKDFSRLLRVSEETVLPLGGLGTFDEHGIFPLNVLPFRGRVLGYTCGWSRRVSVPVETSVGLVISTDGGETFQRYGDGPVMTSSLHEPYLVGDAFVRHYNGQFHMWYMFGTDWIEPGTGAAPERTYKIGHATSDDGIVWEKEEARRIISDRLGERESQALPSVIRIDDRYHMFFCYRESLDFRTNTERAYRIGHAWSADLKNWHRDDADPGIDVSDDGWDSEMLCYPHVFECEGQVYLLYNGNQFGRYGFGLAVLEND